MSYLEKTERELMIDIHMMLTAFLETLKEMKERQIEMNKKIIAIYSRKKD
jgi:hypothetical protein